ncbi:hypothetical protein LGK95_21125 [Clostridium algoriphilum]|uniref:hypothetical protein n=1 Tax=Clostridium algoriphilum TaxID=198347 RepID=UPI001CF2AE8C|nr:hypothetical protein [Clostridium algoriphilum]MCB2295958.1 hypothetical protein [Clostridium algoriphilum]
MITSELKNRVAQNCSGYTTTYSIALINSITYGSKSCGSCVNYQRGRCIEELFDEIREIIKLN